jgi:hypothetical protein
MKRFLSNVVQWSAKRQMGNEVRSLFKSVRPQVEYLEAREVLSGLDWFSTSLPDAAVASLARSDYADHGAINYNDMLGIYSQIAQDGSVDSSEYASLQSLAQNASVLNMPDYVSFLSTAVIDTTNPANSSFQGISLPELGPGSPASTLVLLVGKWFLGADHPTMSEEGLTYSTVPGTLFGSSGPSFQDVAQGDAIDCWLMSSLATTAARDSSVIQNMFIYDGQFNGTDIWTVRFFEDGSPVYVTVDNQLPTKDGSIVYDRPQDGVLWAALAEKAYAQLNEFAPNITPSPGENSYAAVDQQADGYQAMNTLSTLTGQDTTAEGPDDTWTLIQSGRPAVLLALEPSWPYLREQHFYAAIDYDPSTGHFTVYDPYGIQQSQADGKWGLFWANETFLHENFDYVVGGLGGGTKPTERMPAGAADPMHSEGLPMGNDSRSSNSASGAGKMAVAPPLLADAVFARSKTQAPGDAVVESLVHALSQDGHDQDVQAADFARRMDSLFDAVG